MIRLPDSFPALPEFPAGEVWLTGAGPGDPRFLTLLAAHALAAADVIVWCCDEQPGFAPSRPQDRSFVGNIVQAMEAYASGKLGTATISMGATDRLIAIGSDRMMAAVAAARHGVLQKYLKHDHVAIASINSLMQCMLIDDQDPVLIGRHQIPIQELHARHRRTGLARGGSKNRCRGRIQRRIACSDKSSGRNIGRGHGTRRRVRKLESSRQYARAKGAAEQLRGELASLLDRLVAAVGAEGGVGAEVVDGERVDRGDRGIIRAAAGLAEIGRAHV